MPAAAAMPCLTVIPVGAAGVCGVRRIGDVVCCLAASAETSLESESLSLSGRERRKQRNARREELKTSRENWREEVERRLDVKKKKLQGWEQELDTNRLAQQGLRWWMLQVFKNKEKELADHFEVEFPERFPGEHFEVLVPSVPCGKAGRGGAYFDGRKRLFPCIVLIRCVLNRDKYNFFARTYNVMDFFGHKAGPSYLDRIMPAPVSINQIEDILEQVRKAEADWKEAEVDRQRVEEIKAEEKERKKEEAKVIAADKRRQAKEERERMKMRQMHETNQAPVPMLKPFRVGDRIMAISGPFQDFTGVVVQSPKKGEKVKVYFTMHGREQAAAIDPSQIIEIGADNNEALGG